ncbi:MAG: amidohydrolase family protein [Aequoribacter sp.]|uniref:amidohydrolase family protein n=1 Tax=Aequoribacter sp. TaxID=2847771 RepID=UPI003C6AF695
MHRIRTHLLLPLLLATLPAQALDLAIIGGRVIDPETHADKVLNVGVQDGRIVALTTDSLEADRVINAQGRVVAPGFIDIHSHTPTPFGIRLNILDGITTALDTEAGAYPVYEYGDAIKDNALVNFGASIGHFAARIQVIEGKYQPYFFHKDTFAGMSSAAFEQPATDEEIEEIRQHLNQGIAQGGLGIGLLLDYMRDAVTDKELRMIFEVAADHDVPVFTHVRRNLPGDPSGLIEILGLAKSTGAAVFICHITHNAMGSVGDWLDTIDQARADGVRVTTETLSYLAGGTSISADVFRKRDWQAIFDITYEDVQWVATGEWLTEETWDYYAKHEASGAVNHHYVKEPWLHTALRWPDMMISTDALPAFTHEQFSNPNIAGTFSLVLGRYVREQGILTLSDALSRMSLKQAQWLEPFAPAFKRKGRIQLGMDADIVIFDADTVAATADYGKPYDAPTGIHWVIVNGQVAVVDGTIQTSIAAGKRLTTLAD